jgi:hypothetical protein
MPVNLPERPRFQVERREARFLFRAQVSKSETWLMSVIGDKAAIPLTCPNVR